MRASNYAHKYRAGCRLRGVPLSAPRDCGRGACWAAMLDGVVAQGWQELLFRGARVDKACVERVQAAVRQRVLGLFERLGLLSRETAGVMQGWGHRGGFSVLPS